MNHIQKQIHKRFPRYNAAASVAAMGLAGLIVLSLLGPKAVQAQDDRPPKTQPMIWTTATTLAPGFGFWVRPGDVNKTSPLGATSRYKTSVVGTGTLTWVADFPQSGLYQVWVRHFGYQATLLVNEKPVTGGRGGPEPGAGYVWWHLGEIAIEKGPAHVDIVSEQSALDVVLFTMDKDLDPEKTTLPEAVTKPVLRAPRKYRSDTHLKDAAGTSGLVAGQMNDPYQEHCNDWVPTEGEILKTLSLWGSPNQHVTGTFCLRALDSADDVEISFAGLASQERQLDPRYVDLKVAHLRERSIAAHSEHTALSGTGIVPDLLLRDDRTAFPPTGKQGGYGGGRCVTSIPAHESRQIWVTVQLPTDCLPGEWHGSIDICVKDSPEKDSPKRKLSIPVVVKVLPIDLKPVEGYYGSFYRSYLDAELSKTLGAAPGAAISPEQFLAELRFQVRYGLNAATLYEGATMLPYAREAGMTQPPVSMVPRTTGGRGAWEDEARRQIALAKAMGFPDLYFYGVDEAHSEAAIAMARAAAESAMEVGIHAQESFMGPADYETLKDVVTRPVLMTYNFNLSSTRNELVQYANQKGFLPISYWFSDSSYPMKSRALVGLYNTACGYHGAAPWATQDYGSGVPATDYFYYYPDAAGEPIPTIRFEALRHGIDDVRYLQALDRALSTAEGRLQQQPENVVLQKAMDAARLVRKNRFESISGGYVSYCSSSNAAILDHARWEMAEAIVALSQP